MEKKLLLKKVAFFGFVANKQALDKLSKLPSYLVEKILETAKKKITKPFLTGEIVDKIVKEIMEKGKRIDIEVRPLPKSKQQKKIEINDVVDYLLRRYQKISAFLSNRIELANLISIGKIKGKISSFSIVGLVREVDRERGKILLEDPTGQIEIFFENPEELKFVVPDEVIGIFCAKKGGFFVGKRIVFPDVPIRRQIKRTNKKIYLLFVCDADKCEKAKEKITKVVKDKDVVVVGFGSSKKFLNGISKQTLKTIEIGEKGLAVKIRIGSVRVLCLYKEPIEKYSELFGTDSIETLNQLLKKRHLDPIFNFDFSDETFLLEEEPDIIAVGGLPPGIKNYKGITLVACDKNMGWIIDLSTRESLKLEFG